MDEAAQELGLSPLEIRRRNMLCQGDETVIGQKLDDHTVSLDQVLAAVAIALLETDPDEGRIAVETTKTGPATPRFIGGQR